MDTEAQLNSSDLKVTPLVQEHRAAGARMVPFSGWLMPVQYAGILAEHHHTRQAVSLFDCSHMGQFRLTGSSAAADLDRLLPRRAGNQPVGSCRYNFLLTEQGTVVDDIVVYRLAKDEFYIVVNAGTIDGDAAWLRQRLSPSTRFADESAVTAKLDLQGPGVLAVMARLGWAAAELPAYFHCRPATLNGEPILLSRTGYTGEAGFEFYLPAASGVALWRQLLAIEGVLPAGLGARDTLRLEMGYPLYGHELNLQTTPVEAGFGRMLDLERPFVGRDSLVAAPKRQLAGILLEGRRAAREGTPLTDTDGQSIGQVTSGSFSPSLGQAIAMAYVTPAAARAGTRIVAGSGRAEIPGTVVDLPFYRRGTARQH